MKISLHFERSRSLILVPLALLVSAAALAGCASTNDYVGITSSSDLKYVQDDEYVAAVERVARQRGVDVVWVHPPEVAVQRTDD